MLIKFNKPGLFHCEGLTLKPGTNTVDDAKWARVRKHPNVQHKIEEEIIEELTELVEDAPEGDESGGSRESDFDHLKTLKVPGARSLVKETVDIALLEEWQRREDRPQVKQSLAKQIALMKEPLEKRDRGQKRQLATGGKVDEIYVEAKPNASDD